MEHIKGWNLKLYGAHSAIEKDGVSIAHVQGGLGKDNPDVAYLIRSAQSFENLLEAFKEAQALVPLRMHSPSWELIQAKAEGKI